VGRRRLHDEHTRRKLLAEAERLVAEGGIDAVGVRAVAVRAGTTTRAVYALFGSKEELVQALGQRAFDMLMERVAEVPLTNDPGRDLIDCAVSAFRPFVLEHPDLFRLFFNTQLPRSQLTGDARGSAMAAYGQLAALVGRAHDAGLLGRHSVEDATVLWDALCTGLATREICGPIQPSQGARIWTVALEALLAGLGSVQKTRTSKTDNGANPRTTRRRRRAPTV